MTTKEAKDNIGAMVVFNRPYGETAKKGKLGIIDSVSGSELEPDRFSLISVKYLTPVGDKSGVNCYAHRVDLFQ